MNWSEISKVLTGACFLWALVSCGVCVAVMASWDPSGNGKLSRGVGAFIMIATWLIELILFSGLLYASAMIPPGPP